MHATIEGFKVGSEVGRMLATIEGFRILAGFKMLSTLGRMLANIEGFKVGKDLPLPGW